jgi:hypothetical protein
MTSSLLLSGTLSIDLGGADPGSGYDQVITATGAQIFGNLSLTLVNGFRPSLGESFFIIDDTSSDPTLRTIGTFSNATIMDSGGDTYTVVYGHDPNNPSTFPNDVELIAVGVVPEPATWALMVGGILLIAAVRLRGARSIPSDKA